MYIDSKQPKPPPCKCFPRFFFKKSKFNLSYEHHFRFCSDSPAFTAETAFWDEKMGKKSVPSPPPYAPDFDQETAFWDKKKALEDADLPEELRKLREKARSPRKNASDDESGSNSESDMELTSSGSGSSSDDDDDDELVAHECATMVLDEGKVRMYMRGEQVG